MTETCQCCGKKLMLALPAVSDPITRDVFSVWRCVHCGLGHTVPRPDELGAYYPASYYGHRHGATARFCIKRRLSMLTSLGNASSQWSLLDIGCGDGAFLLAAEALGWRVTGLERFPCDAREKGLEVATDARELAGRQFDCITLWHSLEHMPEPVRTLRQAAALLKPEGRIVIAVPDSGGWQAHLFGRYWLHLDVPRHVFHFTPSSLREGLSRADLDIMLMRHQEMEYDLLGWAQSLLNALFPTPNAFFNWLTKKPVLCGKRELFTQLAFGFVFLVLCVPLVWIGALSKRGGTLIVIGGFKACTRTNE